VEPSRRELIEIGRLIDAGVVRPIVESVLPLERAREAFERGLDGRNRGKLVLHVGNGSAVSAGGAMIRDRPRRLPLDGQRHAHGLGCSRIPAKRSS